MSTLLLFVVHSARNWFNPSSLIIVSYYTAVAHAFHGPIQNSPRFRWKANGWWRHRPLQIQYMSDNSGSISISSRIGQYQVSETEEKEEEITEIRGVGGNTVDENLIFQRTIHDRHDLPVFDLTRSYFPIFYNDVYEVNLPPHHRFPMAKYGQVRKMVQGRIQENTQWLSQQLEAGLPSRVICEFCVSPLATVEELTTTHSPDYVARYLRGDQTDRELRNVGFPWSVDGVRRSLSSTGGTVAAVRAVCDAIRIRQRQAEFVGTPSALSFAKNSTEKIQMLQKDNKLGNRKPLIWSAHIAGGTHHAFYDRGEGFCVFSDIAVAANIARQSYGDVIQKAILILDLDVHQGNGNAVLFQGRQDVITFSMHCDANYFSPKEKSDLDVELPAGCTDETYLGTLRYWLRQISKQKGDVIDLVFFQAGVDVLAEDRLGRMELTQQGVRRRNEMVFDFCKELGVPLIITMGGGYPRNETSWEAILEAHANVYTQAWQYMQTHG